ncbi:MAG TPA: LysR family transcriptional regulator [Candidatus Dormibacteraeota bacterium]|nr:LysR family transcriptional regulator [Candidatus Dormibacteraeota bacterium]
MLLAQIEGFLEVARRGNVSRAAEAMFVTQPTLTARLHALEREVGEPLFARTRRGMRLTDAGRAFLPYAERAIRAVRDGKQALVDARSASAGRLVLGAAPAVSTYVLPAILQRFAAAYPRVDVAVRTGHSEDVLQMLLREEVQLAMVRALRHPDIESTPLYEEALVLVVPPGHPFAERPKVGIADVASERLIFFDRTSSYYELTQSFFLSLGVTPREVMELDNIESTKKMVERKLGIALLPRSAVAGELAARTLVQVPVGDAPVMTQKIVVIRRRDQGRASGPVAAFLNLLRDADPAALAS